MSSTNKTTNYELSQFIGADKPAWLSDYNTDMSKIDTGVHNAQTTATAADGKADANTANIGTLSNLSTTAKTSLVAAINEVDTNADAAQGSADNANTTANAAKLVAEGVAAYLNLNNVNANLTVTSAGGTTVGYTALHSAYNSDGTLGKIYGYVELTKTNNQDSTLTISDTGLRPTTQFTITNGLLVQYNGDHTLFAVDLVVNTNGTASFVIPAWTGAGGSTGVRVFNQPYLIFAKKFDA